MWELAGDGKGVETQTTRRVAPAGGTLARTSGQEAFFGHLHSAHLQHAHGLQVHFSHVQHAQAAVAFAVVFEPSQQAAAADADVANNRPDAIAATARRFIDFMIGSPSDGFPLRSCRTGARLSA